MILALIHLETKVVYQGFQMVDRVHAQRPSREEIYLTAPWIKALREVCEVARIRFPTTVQPILNAIQRAIPESVCTDGSIAACTLVLNRRQREGQIRIANICEQLAQMLKVRE